MIGRAKVMLRVASIRMTLKLRVILTTPPSVAAAPSSANLPGFTHVAVGKMARTPTPSRRPQTAPTSRVGMKTPLDTLSPYVQQLRKKYTTKKPPSVAALHVPSGWWKRLRTLASGVWNQIWPSALYRPSEQLN
uniref:Putative secreted protein n=1 Tax=Ixodes ricinus TaxID=34613 RepID=A0A6B0URM9_IXORI